MQKAVSDLEHELISLKDIVQGRASGCIEMTASAIADDNSSSTTPPGTHWPGESGMDSIDDDSTPESFDPSVETA